MNAARARASRQSEIRKDEINVCGLAVHHLPAAREAVVAALAALPGVEICAEAEGGRLAVTVIDTEATMAIDQIAEIHRTPGVVAASLVYARVATRDEDASPRADRAPFQFKTEGFSS